MITPALIAALASSVAAILSGIALWLGGRREEHKWRRDALVDTVVQFLDASFASPGDKLLDKVRKSTLTDEDREEVDQVHKSALTALTRLRVLASEDVVVCAEELHLVDDYAYDIVSGKLAVPEQKDWDAKQEERQERLHEMLSAARREFRLEKAVKPNPALYGSTSSSESDKSTQHPDH